MLDGRRAALADRPDAGDMLDDDTVARLAAIAENPMAPPSHRIRARTALRRHRDALEAVAGDGVVKRTLAARIARGEALGWRDRAAAARVGLDVPAAD